MAARKINTKKKRVYSRKFYSTRDYARIVTFNYGAFHSGELAMNFKELGMYLFQLLHCITLLKVKMYLRNKKLWHSKPLKNVRIDIFRILNFVLHFVECTQTIL